MQNDPHLDTPVDPAIAAVERAMVRIRRSMSRRALGRQMSQGLEEPVDLLLVGVVDAVEQGQDEAHPEVTVGDVAERLGIDPSRASRLVSSAIETGYLRRGVSQADGRRSVLELTDAGCTLAASVRATRQRYFAKAMQDWAEADRVAFARLLTRFVEGTNRA